MILNLLNRLVFAKFLIIAFAFFCTFEIFSKILILIPVFNRPDFIELQCKTFKKFLKDDDYEIIYFNDANNSKMEESIRQTCEKYNVKCVRVPQTLHQEIRQNNLATASFRHGNVLQFAYSNFAMNHDDIFAVFDSDVFLIREWSIREYLGDCDLNAWGPAPPWNHSLWVHYLVMNIPKLPGKEHFSFRSRMDENGRFVEVGSDMEPYLKNNLQLKIRPVHVTFGVHDNELQLDPNRSMASQLIERGYSNAQVQLIQNIHSEVKKASAKNPRLISRFKLDCDVGFFDTNLFIDYKHGSGWHDPNQKMKIVKDRLFYKFMDEILNQP